MQNNDNQKTYFIYVRSTGEKVPVTKEQHDSFYKEADRIRHKRQVTPHLWINLSRTATAHSAIISLTATNRWMKS